MCSVAEIYPQSKAELCRRYKSRVRAVARLAPVRCREEAEQAGMVGLLVALQRWSPAAASETSKDPFWAFARNFVRDEIRAWLGTAVFLRRVPHRNAAKREAVQVIEVPIQDDVECVVFTEDTPESLSIEAEDRRAFHEFVDGLSVSDRATLLSGDLRTWTRGHKESVARARTVFGAGKAVGQ